MLEYGNMSVHQAVGEQLLPVQKYVKQLGRINIFPGYSVELALDTAEDVTDEVYNEFKVLSLDFVIRLYKGPTFIGAGDYNFHLDFEHISNMDTVGQIIDEVFTDALLMDGCKSHLLFGINQYTTPFLTLDKVNNYIEYLNVLRTEKPMFGIKWPHYYSQGGVDDVEENTWRSNNVILDICRGLMLYSPTTKATEIFCHFVDAIAILDPTCRVSMVGGFVLNVNIVGNYTFIFEEQLDGSHILVDAPHRLLDEYNLAHKLASI